MIICYSISKMVHDRCNYLSFWAIFCPYTPLTAQKRKIYKKWNKHLEISSFYTSVQKIMIRWYTVPEIWCVADLKAKKNQNFDKMKKMPGDIIILDTCTKNYDQKMYSSWDMLRDRRTERWHIEVGASPKNMKVLLNLTKDFTLLIMFNILVSK